MGRTIEYKEIMDTVEALKIKVERTSFILSEFMQDYGLDIKPDPEKALNWFNNPKEVSDKEEIYSAKWFTEYWRIQQLLRMALDFNFEAEDLILELEETIKPPRSDHGQL